MNTHSLQNPFKRTARDRKAGPRPAYLLSLIIMLALLTKETARVYTLMALSPLCHPSLHVSPSQSMHVHLPDSKCMLRVEGWGGGQRSKRRKPQNVPDFKTAYNSYKEACSHRSPPPPTGHMQVLTCQLTKFQNLLHC